MIGAKENWLVFTLFILLCCSLLSCNSSSNNETDVPEKHSDLVIEMKMNSGMPIGYAYTYLCEVEEVNNGTLDMDTVIMTVMAGDQNNDFIMDHLSPAIVRASFSKKNENETRSLPYHTGFINRDKTSWELDSITAVK